MDTAHLLFYTTHCLSAAYQLPPTTCQRCERTDGWRDKFGSGRSGCHSVMDRVRKHPVSRLLPALRCYHLTQFASSPAIPSPALCRLPATFYHSPPITPTLIHQPAFCAAPSQLYDSFPRWTLFGCTGLPRLFAARRRAFTTGRRCDAAVAFGRAVRGAPENAVCDIRGRTACVTAFAFYRVCTTSFPLALRAPACRPTLHAARAGFLPPLRMLYLPTTPRCPFLTH